MDRLWGLAQGAGDAQVRAVYGLVVELAGELPSGPDLDLLYDKVAAALAAPAPVGAREAELLRGFAERAAFRDDREAFGYGLEVLWRCAQQDDNAAAAAPPYVSEEGARACAAALAGVFAQEGGGPALGRLLEECAGNLRARRSEAPTLRLLQLVLEGQPEAGRGMGAASGRSRDRLIEELERQYGLLELVVADVGHYLARSKAAAAEPPAGGASGRLSHAEALQVRLDFLGFCLASSNLTLDFKQIKQLWDAAVPAAAAAAPRGGGGDDRAAFLAWLRRAAPREGPAAHYAAHYAPAAAAAARRDFQAMDEKAARRVFQELLCAPAAGLDLTALTADGWGCLEQFFRYVNAKDKRLSSSHQKTYFLVEDPKLAGLDTLWAAFGLAADEEVHRAAADFLLHLYLRLGGRLDREAVWRDFVDRALRHLAGAADGTGDRAYDLAAMRRALALTLRFLEEVEKPYGILNVYHAGQADQAVRVRLRVRRGAAAAPVARELVYTFARGAVSVGALRARVAADARHPPDRVRLVSSGRQPLRAPDHDRTAVERAGLAFGDAVLLKKPAPDTQGYEPLEGLRAAAMDARSDRAFPKAAVAADPRHLRTLERLLEVGDREVRALAWRLVQMLPTPDRVRREIGQLSLDPPASAARRGGVLGKVRGSKAAGGRAGAADEEGAGAPPDPEGPGDAAFWARLLPGAAGEAGEGGGGGGGALALLQRLGHAGDLARAAAAAHALPGDRAAARAWARAFARRGGLQRLLDLLLEPAADELVAGPARKGALAALLRLTAQFLAAPEAGDANDSDGEEDDEDASSEEEEEDSSSEEEEDEGEGQGEGGEEEDVSSARPPPPPSSAAGQGSGWAHGGSDFLTQVYRAGPGDPSLQAEADRRAALARLGEGAGAVPRLLGLMHAVARAVDPVSPEELAAARARRQAQRAQKARGVAMTLGAARAQGTGGAAGDAAGDWAGDGDGDGDGGGSGGGAGAGGRAARSSEAAAVRHAMALLVTLTLERPAELEAVLAFDGLQALLGYALLRAPEAALRRAVAQGLQKLCRASAAPEAAAARVAELLLRLLDEVDACPRDFCEQYFAAAGELLAAPGALGARGRRDLCRRLAREVVQGAAVEEGASDADRALRGRLLLLNAALEGCPDPQATAAIKEEIGPGLIPHLWEDGLFALPAALLGPSAGDAAAAAAAGPQLPKCKSAATRGLAFLALAQLARGAPRNFDRLLALAAPHHPLGRPQEERVAARRAAARGAKHKGAAARAKGAGAGARLPAWHFAKSKTGFVGLKNLGCICYMNSSLQQFFMIPEFRRELLGFECEDEDPDESLMHQLQLLFAQLQESEKAYYNPAPFCRAFKNWEGEPTDVLVQQDASEFLTMFFQHVEGGIMGSASEGMLKHSFGGEICNELLAKEQGKRSERAEPFYYLSVDVRNNKTLEAALGAYVAGESVEYTWESEPEEEGGEVRKELLPTEKRASLKRLPRHLVVHLKRFEFDFETMQQAKINARFEFGMDLDMLPYTVEGREDGSGPAEGGGAAAERGPADYYNYTLCGAVVHVGTANSGHYYSYVRERGTDRWFEFNDTYVGDFDPAQLPDECFGGEEERFGGGAGGGHSHAGVGVSIGAGNLREKIRNAFLVIYDRNDVWAEEAAERRGAAPGTHYKAPLPAAIAEETRRENVAHWTRKNLHDRRYFDFLTGLLRHHVEHESGGEGAGGAGGAPPPRLPRVSAAALGAAAGLALGTAARAGDADLARAWADRLCHGEDGDNGWIQACPTGAAAVLSELTADPEALKELLLETGDAGVRQAAARVLEACAAAAAAADPPGGDRFAAALLGLLPDAQAHWRRMGQYFRLLGALAARGGGGGGLRLLLDRGCLGRLLSFFLAEESPHPELVHPDYRAGPKMGDAYNHPSYEEFLHLLGALLEATDLRCSMDEDRPAAAADGGRALHSLGQQEAAMVYSRPFARRLLREIRSPALKAAAARPLRRLAGGSRLMSTLFEQEVVSGIDEEEYLNLKPLYRGAMILLGIDDELANWRVRSMMPKLMKTIEDQAAFIKATEVSLELLLRLAKNCARAQAWLVETRAEHRWVDQWLQDKKSGKVFAAGSGMTLYKPKRFGVGGTSSNIGGGGYSGGSISSSNIPKPSANAMQVHEMQGVFKALGKGNIEGASQMLQEHYDSDDDPRVLVGRKVKVRWMHDKWYPGEIDGYDSATGRHHVTYTDGDEREYVLAEKTWNFL